MTPDDQTQLDAALEALARQAPPADHVAQVLATSGPAAVAVPSHSGTAAYLRPRWVLPVAATLLLASGAFWQASRTAQAVLPQAPVDGSPHARWGAPLDVDRPVLPPEMYWAMDPFAEFATLQSTAPRRGIRTAPSSAKPAVTLAMRSADPSVPTERPLVGPADDEHAWTPTPRDLPTIEVASIVPAPVTVVPLARPATIDMLEIAMAPIALAPIDLNALAEEENP